MAYNVPFFSLPQLKKADKLGLIAGTFIGAIIPITTGIFHENIALHFAQKYADKANADAVALNHEIALHNTEIMRHHDHPYYLDLDFPWNREDLREYVKDDYTAHDFLSSGSHDALILIIVTSIAAMIILPTIGWALGKKYAEIKKPTDEGTQVIINAP